ncbi:MAG: vWA domain-containing protein, partial [Pirellulaceae bacterium]
MVVRRWSVWCTLALSCLGGSQALEAGTAALGPVLAASQQSRSLDSRMATYRGDDGIIHFALSLRAQELGESRGVPTVILVDTSASQTGRIRRDSLAVVDALIEGMDAGSEVAILACDVSPVDLSGGLHRRSESVIDHATASLRDRVPLGATNFKAALESAIELLADRTDGAIIYVGDGVHRSQLFEQESMAKLVERLREHRVSVHSLAIGPFYDVALLASLASHTGGTVLIRDRIEATTQQIGTHLAHAASAPVFWPQTLDASQPFASRFPEAIPPIRADRDSILLGSLPEESWNGKVTLRGTLAGAPTTLAWDVQSEASHPDFAFLPLVVEKAKKDLGLMLPIAGSEALKELGGVLAASSLELVKSGRFALQSGDAKGALEIANEALRRDPDNVEASSLRDAARKRLEEARLVRPVVFVQAPPGDQVAPPVVDGSVIPPAAGEAVQPGVAPPLPGELFSPAPGLDDFSSGGDLLAEEEGNRRRVSQRMEAEVRNQIREANRTIVNDPSSAIANLKALQAEVRRTSELDPGLRTQLESRLGSTLQAAARRERANRDRQAQADQAAAAANASRRLLDERNRREYSIQQLVERFNSLMQQQLFAEANSDIAPVVKDLARDSVIARVVELESSIAANQQLMEDVVDRRRRAFVDALYLNEAAAIPFVDEPPVVYPPPEVWRTLTARRERFASIDLSSGSSKSEQLIYDSLKQKVNVDFRNRPLRDVVDDLCKQAGDVPFYIDDAALEEAGQNADDQVTRTLPDVSFRSALRLILEPLDLTYVIQDEVLKITTKDKSEAAIVKVYPVGDLVVPVFPIGGGMMGGM